MDATKQPGLAVAQVFMTHARFEHREDALGLPVNTPVGDLAIVVNLRAGGNEDASQGAIVVSVETVDTENPLYRFQVEYMAILAQDPDNKNMTVKEFVEQGGAGMLFPYVREAVSNLTARGRFGPTWLKPFNVTLGMNAVEAPKP
jgi:preprotein translocase subunit SecB